MSSSTSSSASSSSRVAVAQLCSTSNKLNNLVNVATCAGWAKRDGASMLLLPECFGFMGESAQQTVEEADPPIVVGESSGNQDTTNDIVISSILEAAFESAARGDTPRGASETSNVPEPTTGVCILAALQTIARASGLWISGGGMHVAGAPPAEGSDQPRVYNTHIIVDDQGTVKCLYRKIHLFDVHIPDKVNLRESATTAPGTELVVCDTPIGVIGLTTCYDVRFPEMYIPLVNQMGAQILLVPSAFTVPTGSAHWHTLLRARAIEHQCYVLAAAQYGRHNEKRESYGHSLAVDPWGKVVADAGGCDGPGTQLDGNIVTPNIILCDIDVETIQSTRTRMPIQQHRDAAKF